MRLGTISGGLLRSSTPVLDALLQGVQHQGLGQHVPAQPVP
jgi:hypothetical protein